MPKGFNMSQFNSQMRQAQRKAEQQVRQAQQKAERQMKSELNKVTRKLESDMNRELRKYNSQLRKNRKLITRQLNQLNSQSTVRNTYTTSVNLMHNCYVGVNVAYEDSYITPSQERIIDLIEKEQINSLVTANALANDDLISENIEDIEIGNKLAIVSEDLDNRWKGAVYALNPKNPDAARHFCTSAREIFTEFIEMKAADNDVFAYNPNCAKTERGNATRKEKIKYMMRNIDINDSIVDFADADINNILELFHVLSDGTHGAAGRYEYTKLLQVKKRVEQGINFLCEICA